MTAIWMWLLGSRMVGGKGRGGAMSARWAIGTEAGMAARPALRIGAAMGLLLLALVSCNRAGSASRESATRAGVAAEIKVGSLACLDTAAAGSGSVRSLPVQCPLLVVAVDSSRDSARLIGPADREYRIPVSILRRIGPARLPGGFAGATDTVLERMAPGPNPGVLTPQTAFGLLFGNASGTMDTVYPVDLPALPPSEGGEAVDIEACLDSLSASPSFGLLFPPFVPDLQCDAGSSKIWKGTGDSVVEVGPGLADRTPGGAMATPDTAQPPRVASWKSSFSLKALAKPGSSVPGGGNHSAHPPGGKDWIFLVTADGYFIWRVKGGKARILEAPFMENSEPESIVAADVDGDSLPEFLLEVKTHDGDGFYTTLYVLKGGPQGQADDAPRMGSIGLEGSYAEADGSTVESDWWIRPPYIYHAYAQAANPGGRGISHDTRLDAYGFSDSNGFARTSPRFSAAAYFGVPGAKWNAQAICDSLSAIRPEAARAGIRPLPRLGRDGIYWQAGALAADLATAERWSGWHPSGKAESLSYRPGKDPNRP